MPAFTVTPAQQEILEHPARIKVAACGRRWGKSTIQAIALACVAQKYPGSKSWYVSPDLGRVMEQLRAMERNPLFMSLVRRKWGQFPPRFDMKNGSEIGFRSCEKPDRLVGRGLKFIAFDEASLCAQEVWYQVLYPMLADTRGSALLASTFRGKNWFYDLAMKGLSPNEDGVKSWRYPSSAGLAFQSEKGKAILEEIKRSTPLPIWRQEWECEPLSSVDQAFKFVDQCIGGELHATPRPGHRYILAVDIGAVQDPAALLILDATDGTVSWFETFPLGTTHAIQAERARQLMLLFRTACVVIDCTGGGAGGHKDSVVPLYAQALPGAHQIKWSVSWKYNAVHYVDILMQQKKIKIPPDAKDVINQVKDYRFFPSRTSEMCQYGAPAGHHDDLVAALLMACWAMHENWAGGTMTSLAPG